MTKQIRVSDYGAVGDGVADDSTSLQDALDAAIALKRPLQFDAKTYLVNTELKANAHALEMYGCGWDVGGNLTAIKAGAAIRSCMAISGSFNNVEGIEFNAATLANYAMFSQGVSVSVFLRCAFTHATLDGIHFPRYRDEVGQPFAESDSNHFSECSALSNGRLFVSPGMSTTYATSGIPLVPSAGTVSCVEGSRIVSGAGTAFLAMAARDGDFIRIGPGLGTDQFLQIESVDSDAQITVGVRRVADATLNMQAFAIGVGNGYNELQSGGNNHNRISGGLWRSNAGCGIQVGGLYGPLIEHVQMDTMGFYGIVVGRTHGGSQTFNTTVLHP